LATFGASTALSADGNTAIVGGFGDNQGIGANPQWHSGTRYWFVAATQDLINQGINMYINQSGATGLNAERIGNGQWVVEGVNKMAAFRIE